MSRLPDARPNAKVHQAYVDAIRQWMRHHGVSQERLAQLTGLSEHTINSYLIYRRWPAGPNRAKIQAATGIRLDQGGVWTQLVIELREPTEALTE